MMNPAQAIADILIVGYEAASPPCTIALTAMLDGMSERQRRDVAYCAGFRDVDLGTWADVRSLVAAYDRERAEVAA